MPIPLGVIAKKQIPVAAQRLAARQGGVLTYAQAVGHLGRTPLRRLLATGEWVSVTPGIVATDRVVTDEARLWAGHLLGGPGSALRGRAALHRTGVGEAPRDVEVWIPSWVKKRVLAGASTVTVSDASSARSASS